MEMGTQNHARFDVTQEFIVYTLMQNNTQSSTTIHHLESGRETNLDSSAQGAPDGQTTASSYLVFTGAVAKVEWATFAFVLLGQARAKS